MHSCSKTNKQDNTQTLDFKFLIAMIRLILLGLLSNLRSIIGKTEELMTTLITFLKAKMRQNKTLASKLEKNSQSALKVSQLQARVILDKKVEASRNLQCQVNLKLLTIMQLKLL